MKKYREFIKESIGLLNSVSDSLLKEKLISLQLERDDLNNEINTINAILSSRKDSSIEDFIKTLPESIFDFNKEQLFFIFEHHNGVGKLKYDISIKYFNQLKGVLDAGFNKDTNQFYFKIITSRWMNYDNNEFEEKSDSDEILKSIKFLGDNLQRVSGKVKFGILSQYINDYSSCLNYTSDSDIIFDFGSRYGEEYEFSNIKDMIKFIVSRDKDDDDDDYRE
jgi:hypothetical protein